MMVRLLVMMVRLLVLLNFGSLARWVRGSIPPLTPHCTVLVAQNSSNPLSWDLIRQLRICALGLNPGTGYQHTCFGLDCLPPLLPNNLLRWTAAASPIPCRERQTKVPVMSCATTTRGRKLISAPSKSPKIKTSTHHEAAKNEIHDLTIIKL